MITRDNARDAFFGRLPNGDVSEDPRNGFTALFAFRRDCPVTGGVGKDADGDMMLFQYGTFDWGDGNQFELNLTRQIIFIGEAGGDDPEIWQLGLTYRYDPDGELTALGADEQWLDDVIASEAILNNHLAVTTAAQRTPSTVSVDWAPT